MAHPNPLTSLELPPDVKPILRHVLYRMRGPIDSLRGETFNTIECNTPTNGCFRCVKYFWIHEQRGEEY